MSLYAVAVQVNARPEHVRQYEVEVPSECLEGTPFRGLVSPGQKGYFPPGVYLYRDDDEGLVVWCNTAVRHFIPSRPWNL